MIKPTEADLAAAPENVRTWTPQINWVGHDNCNPIMVPANGGMWVSVSDYTALKASIPDLLRAERVRCADIAAYFSWTLPLLNDAKINEATDDAACSACEQIADAIRAIGDAP